MLAKGPPTFHNSLKITIQETSLKVFSMSTYIINQSRFELGRALMPKGMVSQPLRIKTSKLVGGSVLLKRPLKLSNNGVINKSKKCLTTIIGQRGANKIQWTNGITIKKDYMSFFPQKTPSYEWILEQFCLQLVIINANSYPSTWHVFSSSFFNKYEFLKLSLFLINLMFHLLNW
jgi:hypothetical protein